MSKALRNRTIYPASILMRGNYSKENRLGLISLSTMTARLQVLTVTLKLTASALCQCVDKSDSFLLITGSHLQRIGHILDCVPVLRLARFR